MAASSPATSATAGTIHARERARALVHDELAAGPAEARSHGRAAVDELVAREQVAQAHGIPQRQLQPLVVRQRLHHVVAVEERVAVQLAHEPAAVAVEEGVELEVADAVARERSGRQQPEFAGAVRARDHEAALGTGRIALVAQESVHGRVPGDGQFAAFVEAVAEVPELACAQQRERRERAPAHGR
jgi:hypothetical protein